MIPARHDLLEALGAAIAEVSPEVALAPGFESPKQAAMGDLASTAAMQLAKPLKQPPREVAARLIASLRAQSAVQRWVESISSTEHSPGLLCNRHEIHSDQDNAEESKNGGESVLVRRRSTNQRLQASDERQQRNKLEHANQ